MDLIPSVGVTFHIAKILVDGEELENLSDVTPEKLFRFNENGRVYDIKPMSFVLGQKNFDGTYNTELLDEFINVPGEKVEVHQRSIGDNPVPPFELYTTARI